MRPFFSYIGNVRILPYFWDCSLQFGQMNECLVHICSWSSAPTTLLRYQGALSPLPPNLSPPFLRVGQWLSPTCDPFSEFCQFWPNFHREMTLNFNHNTSFLFINNLGLISFFLFLNFPASFQYLLWSLLKRRKEKSNRIFRSLHISIYVLFYYE